MEDARQRLAEVLEVRAEHEATLAAAERAHLAAVRALADRRAGLATLAGRAEALRSGVAANAEEIERLSEALGEADARTREAHDELEGAREATGVDAEADDGLGERVAEAAQAHDAARARVRELVAAERAAEQQRAHWRARVEALSVGLARRDGSGALLGDGGPDGVLGALSGLVTVEPDARTAVAAALGELADAVAVDVTGRRGRRPAPAARRRRRPGLAGRRDGRRRSRRGNGRHAAVGPRTGEPCRSAAPREPRRPADGPRSWSARPECWPRRCAGRCTASWSWTTWTPRASSPPPASRRSPSRATCSRPGGPRVAPAPGRARWTCRPRWTRR